MNELLIIGVVAVAIIGFLVGYYNRFIKLQNQVESAWSDIDTFLKKRYDLIPNLVNTVKGYASHEANTLEKVTKLRSQAINTESTTSQAAVESVLSGALKSVFAVAEAYPELKANSNFLEIQDQLETLENDLNMARRYYNGTVQQYNNAVETVPGNFIAALFRFKVAEFFEADPKEKENIEVNFA